MRTNDYLTETEEQRRAAIIDNLLYVATYGASKAIIEDASFSLTNTAGDPCTLTISSAGSEYVLMAIVNYRLAYRLQPIELALARGAMHYIYLAAADDMDINPELCSIVTSETPFNDVGHLLLATVDYTEEEAVLDTDTDKQYLANLAAHTMDYTNPHGTTLAQETLSVTKTLLLRGSEIYSHVLYEIASSPGAVPAIIQIEGMTPKFVTPMIEDPDAGVIACKINADGTISVTNSGSAGKKITLKIEGTYLS